MQYAFDMALAQAYGVNEAIFVHRLYWWVRDNAANGRNYRDGTHWTYDSLAALTQIFPFWSRRQIEGVIARCRDKGLIRTADYNTDRRDRTTWYTVTEVVQRAYAPAEMGLPVPGNACPQTGKCIPPNGDAHSTERGNVYNEHLEDQLEDEREGAPAREDAAEPADKPETYGEFANVRLTAAEYGRLLARWRADQVAAGIEALSAYMQSKGKRYASHYATLLGWMKRDYPPEPARPRRKETREL